MTLPNLLLAFATFRQKFQPEWFAHIHSHGHATARLARSFAASCEKRITKRALDEIEFAAYMHDIGKYLVPKHILLKQGSLDPTERQVMSLHPIHGVDILRDLPFVTPAIAQVVLCHHERWDGTGYPHGRAGMSIPFAARVVTIADVYTSLRARRPYKHPLSREGAYELLKKMAGYELDPHMVHDFLKSLEGPVTMRIAKPPTPEELAYSSLIRETLRVVL